MNLRDIEAQSKYGVGAPRQDVLNARNIVSESGLQGLEDALKRGDIALPAAMSIPFTGNKNNNQQ
jgi:hypothetical protein